MVVSSEMPRMPEALVNLTGDTLPSQEPTFKILWELVVDQVCKVTSIVKDHIQRLAIRESSKGLFDAPSVLLLGLALPGEDRDAGGRDAGMHL